MMQQLMQPSKLQQLIRAAGYPFDQSVFIKTERNEPQRQTKLTLAFDVADASGHTAIILSDEELMSMSPNAFMHSEQKSIDFTPKPLEPRRFVYGETSRSGVE